MDNTPAPEFTLFDQHGKRRALKDYRGRWVVLYFYPKDEALGCTKQACSFRDEYRVIKQFGNAEVVGINHGSVDSHKEFSKNHNLQFPILSDPDHAVTNSYKTWRSARQKVIGDRYATQRNTFLIDPQGNIAKSYIGVKRVLHHTERVIAELQKLQAATT